MKKTLLGLLTSVAVITSITAQTENSCNAAEASSTIVKDVVYNVGTLDGESSNLFCEGNGNNVDFGEWVKYVATADALVTVSSDLDQNTGKDTRVQIYTGSCGSLVCVTGDDDDGSGYLSVAEFNSTAGTTYYIVWDDRWNNSSDFDFILTEGALPPPPAESPISFTQTAISAPGAYDLGLVDMNGDFLDDPVSVSGNRIYINYQDDSEPTGFEFVEITTTNADYLPGWSLTIADYDSNGYSDLMYGAGSGVTLMRANSDGTGYTEVNPVDENGQAPFLFSQRGNFVDVNNDGHLDAFMCHDVAPSVTFTNDGNNNLIRDNSNGLGDFSSGGNYASIWIDYDNDLDIDMFMAKCGGSGDRPKNQLYRNDSELIDDVKRNFSQDFTEVSNEPGVNLWDDVQTWSSAWGDFDNDGDMDVYVGSSTGSDHTLMRNDGLIDPVEPEGVEDTGLFPQFTDVTIDPISGVNSGITSNQTIGHESIAHDFDNDGNLDIFTNGSILFGNGDMTFSRVSDLTLPSSYGGAIGDLNNDGYLDFFASGAIYTNNKESGNNWVKIVTIGKSYEGLPNRSNRNGIGARVVLETSSGKQIRDVRAGDGFKYANTLNTHFGIGTEDAITSITVYWPSGQIDKIDNPAINSTIVIPEGDFTLSVNESLVEDLILYPNPTKDFLNLNTTIGLSDAIYSVFDLNGKRILNARLNSETKIDVTALQAGQYILRIISNDTIRTQKFAKY
ncbi:FG-GAP-like repeat-containing protein [Ichthyenterobacterium sp. W332]|uniref:FG-GAP-like repeat-containing protein n=1 Tax=Microcosmobacter mediterraneus TaxID=3075607 RepID=A0ABU2YJB0_9FLAO|nr:ASPIC/UnbV domain-containing protein [Ichthyenterobacterium sp. W332]MDT0558243.1 FG-GAP-like repeat-containing protein [Ichthyenterobacterium sp. W332]